MPIWLQFHTMHDNTWRLLVWSLRSSEPSFVSKAENTRHFVFLHMQRSYNRRNGKRIGTPPQTDLLLSEQEKNVSFASWASSCFPVHLSAKNGWLLTGNGTGCKSMFHKRTIFLQRNYQTDTGFVLSSFQ